MEFKSTMSASISTSLDITDLSREQYKSSFEKDKYASASLKINRNTFIIVVLPQPFSLTRILSPYAMQYPIWSQNFYNL